MLIDLLMKYLPEIATTVAIIGTITPFLNKRVVQDKNIVSMFSNIKDLASKVGIKEADITSTLGKVNLAASALQDRIDKMENQVQRKIEALDRSIINFTESELFKSMMIGLNELNELHQIIDNKEQTIQDIGVILKELRTELAELKQKV